MVCIYIDPNSYRYLQKNLSKNPGRIAFDPACVDTDDKVFKGSKMELGVWKDFYPDAAEAHPRKKLEPMRHLLLFGSM